MNRHTCASAEVYGRISEIYDAVQDLFSLVTAKLTYKESSKSQLLSAEAWSLRGGTHILTHILTARSFLQTQISVQKTADACFCACAACLHRALSAFTCSACKADSDSGISVWSVTDCTSRGQQSKPSMPTQSHRVPASQQVGNT